MRVVNKYLLDCQEVRNGKRGRGRVAMSSVEGGGLSRSTLEQGELFKKYFAILRNV